MLSRDQFCQPRRYFAKYSLLFLSLHVISFINFDWVYLYLDETFS